MPLPRIAITMGDAAGVGPEVIVKTLAHAELYERCRPVVIGDAGRLEKAMHATGIKLAIHAISADGIAGAKFQPGTIDCVDLKLIPADMPWGKLSAVAGDAAYQFIKTATELAIPLLLARGGALG